MVCSELEAVEVVIMQAVHISIRMGGKHRWNSTNNLREPWREWAEALAEHVTCVELQLHAVSPETSDFRFQG